MIKLVNIIHTFRERHPDLVNPTPAALKDVQDFLNREISKGDHRVRLRNDADNQTVVCDIIHDSGGRDTYSVPYAEISEDPTPAEEAPTEDDDLTAEQMAEVLKMADKSQAQWDNLKLETQMKWISDWKAKQSSP